MLSCTQTKEPVDLIVYNAKVYTLDSAFSQTQSFAVKSGKIVETGKSADIISKYQAKEKIDAKKKFIYPGFIDGHCHFFYYGMGILQNANLVGTKSFKEVAQKMLAHSEKYKQEWIIGRGWDQNDWKVKQFPDKSLIDSLFPNNPVVLFRIDGHALLANSEALKRAGITKNSKIKGGEIIIKNGKMTGVLLDNAADLIREKIPALSKKLQIEALNLAQKNCFAVGLTSVVDAGLDKKQILLIDSLQKEKTLKMRVNAMLSPNEENFESFMDYGIYKTDFLNVRSVKVYADGALGSRGAKLIEPYSDESDNNGLLVSTEKQIREICEKAKKRNYQVNTHAIGDSAVRMILNIYAEFLEGKNDLRWRIEHSQVVNENDFSLYKKYSIIPSVQATHATSDMYWAKDRLGENRVKNAYAYKKLLEQNNWIINGTDFPIEQINPIYTFYAAVARKDFNNFPENGFQMENALSREETLKSMTIWAAKGSFEENEKGSLEAGKFADFVILDKDIMEINEKEIPKIKILKTFVGGEMVYLIDNE